MYIETARRMGTAIAERGLGLVYGGGRIGLMGAVADAAMAAGAEVIGVIPEALALKEVAHGGLTQLHVVQTMHQRKAMMAEMADAFIAMPGGYGTFEEFCEVLTWSQLSMHTKPCGLLNVEGYYDPFLNLLDHATVEGFVRPSHRALVLNECDPHCLLERLAAWRPPANNGIEKWITQSET